MSEVGFEPTPTSVDQNTSVTERRSTLKSGALDRSAILTGFDNPTNSPDIRLPCPFFLSRKKWRTGASIPVPLACEASALPFELVPLATSRETNLATFHSYGSFYSICFLDNLISDKSNMNFLKSFRGTSSNGRALDSHSRGTGIDTPVLH